MKIILKALTKEVHQILEQFLNFRQKTAAKMDYIDELYEKFLQASIYAAEKAPAMEATFAHMEMTQLKMYDCLIPRVT